MFGDGEFGRVEDATKEEYEAAALKLSGASNAAEFDVKIAEEQQR